jgi:isoquinoline 1-oxidoreductase subunit beta
MVSRLRVEAHCTRRGILARAGARAAGRTIEGGAVQQKSFDSYRLLRINEAPELDVEIIANGEAPGGIGEPTTALVAPALYNAIYAATGRRLRSLPLSRHGLA